jgi:hypothetical protein
MTYRELHDLGTSNRAKINSRGIKMPGKKCPAFIQRKEETVVLREKERAIMFQIHGPPVILKKL